MGMDKRICARALAYGYATDMLTTQLFSLAMLVVLLDPGSSAHCPAERLTPLILDGMCLVWGLFFTVLGGFVAARVAPHGKIFHALQVGTLSLLTSAAMFQGGAGAQSLVFLIGLVLTIPAAVLGGWVAQRMR